MLRSAAAIAALALAAGCGMGASYPEFANVAYRIEGDAAASAGGAPVHTVIYRDGPRIRVETNVPGAQPATIVFNEATDAAYLLTAPAAAPAQPALNPPTTAAAPAPGATTAAAPATTPAPPSPEGSKGNPAAATTAAVPSAPAPATIGVAVRVADADAPTPMEAPWAALDGDDVQRVGDCLVAGENGHEWRPKSNTQAVRTACITEDGIVLRVRENDRVIFQATSLTRGPQAANLFGIPANYQIVDPEQIARQVGDTMEQLDSVTAKTPAPTQARAPANPG